MATLDLNFVRKNFPALDKDWIYFDNAGGTQTAKQVADRISDYLLTTNVQLGASYEVSVQSGARVEEAQQKWAEVINAANPSEVAFGSSTTMLLQSLARSFSETLKPGDEIIVTNCDHEANIGPWVRLQKLGIVIKTWKVNPDTFELKTDELEKLMTDKTRLVAFTHVSNIIGTINPVKEITKFIHDRGALVCVDGVAYAPHRLVDVQDLDVDFYVFSLYKVYGPHYSLLYGKHEHFEMLPGINHFFIDEIPYKLQPGNVNYELSYGTLGIIDYFRSVYENENKRDKVSLHKQVSAVFDRIENHEEQLSAVLMDFLKTKSKVNLIGDLSHVKEIRVPTISFIVKGEKSSNITQKTDDHKIAIRYGDFYARRLIEELGLSEQDGVVRVSMVHYNSIEEVEQLVTALDRIV